MSVTSFDQQWSHRCAALLHGRRIVDVIYTPRTDTRALGWSMRAPMLVLDSGLRGFPSQDAERNEAGALILTDGGEDLLPPLSLEEYIPRRRRS